VILDRDFAVHALHEYVDVDVRFERAAIVTQSQAASTGHRRQGRGHRRVVPADRCILISRRCPDYITPDISFPA